MAKRALALGAVLILLFTACTRHVVTQESVVVSEDSAGSLTIGHTVPPPSPLPPRPTASPTRSVTPTPAYPGAYAGTPTPNPILADASARPNLDAHVVRPGDTLTSIAWVYGCTVADLVRANGLTDANAIWVGQRLAIPVMPTLVGPALKLVPDSELVYGPAYIHFDLDGFVSGHSGFLVSYSEIVEGRQLSGAEIVQTVAQRFSVGPRVLLALLELQAGWVTNPNPAEDTLVYPMGKVEFRRRGLYGQLEWAAAELNAGFYSWRREGSASARLADGQRVAFAPGLNAESTAYSS